MTRNSMLSAQKDPAAKYVGRNAGPDSRDWQRLAKCRNAPDDDVFFPVQRTGPLAELKRREAEAYARRLYCNHCPVRRECRDYGETINAEWGIWGGHNFDTTDQAKRRNRKGTQHE